MIKEKSLKELLAEFDEIVAWFDGDDLDIDAAIAKFEAGSKLADEIKKKLAESKNKIEIVKKKFNVSAMDRGEGDEKVDE
ncbi:exodeoxyribonuclease VII small subunit [Candidatus Saccharibacteria bacterium]|nr:exodeoxyribonuclease VII small subunit [Candidatus Saccharibacteria bacterium]MCL1962773.1 exodeoxyribonuclease VII small subunit [Candidatus Saccharibacteria bacterium]